MNEVIYLQGMTIVMVVEVVAMVATRGVAGVALAR